MHLTYFDRGKTSRGRSDLACFHEIHPEPCRLSKASDADAIPADKILTHPGNASFRKRFQRCMEYMVEILLFLAAKLLEIAVIRA